MASAVRAVESAEGAGGLVRRVLRHVAQEILERHQARGAAEDVVANLGFDVDHQFLENLERFGLVFDQRIALAVGAQADAVAQAVHLIEMLLPELVDGAENRVALDFLERVRIFEADLQLVSLAHAVGDEIADGELRRAQAVVNRAGHRRFRRRIGRL